MQASDINQQCQAVKENAGFCLLADWAVISLTGPDRKSFLHGMVSNEVNKLRAGQSNYSLLLTAKGKIVADAWVYMREEDILLIARAPLREIILQTLDKFLIMEEAEIHDLTQQHAVIALQGPNAGNMMEQPDCLVIPAALTGQPGGLLVCPQDAREAVQTALLDAGAHLVSPEVLDILRIEAGVPMVGRELDDHVIPQEAGLHHAISFEKGCYIGQEVVARLHFRGHVNRELTRFVLECKEPPTETALIQHEGKDVGTITSACRSIEREQVIGLGYLRSALRKPGAYYTSLIGDNEITVTVL
ncbi:MAG: glycine cleavage T C-terminal barrel domain-containing protein [Candidatus Hinthialibacter antarcticus]|nr:glycine cleavage T C-terminal barrel domain-containing protein [Candidatus Hinthialibacter antarcticus]